MLENLEIEARKDNFFTPKVSFNVQTGVCEISGESYLEDTFGFYKPLREWLNTYIKDINKPITFNFKLTYLNTSSSKNILGILKILKDYENNGGSVTVNWYYRKNDVDMYEDAEDFIYESKLEMELIPF